MRIACVSDLHGYLPEIPECDLVLLGGDIRSWDTKSYGEHARWYEVKVRDWLEKLGRPVIAVAGNHDLIFQNAPHMVPELPWTYLQDSGCMIQGLKVWGSPWQPAYGGMAFNATEAELEERWSRVPEGIDVLLLHGPPRGYGDLSPFGNQHCGSPSLTSRIRDIKPKLVVFGHIHAGYGQYRLGDSLLVNGALVDDSYFPCNEIQVVEIQ